MCDYNDFDAPEKVKPEPIAAELAKNTVRIKVPKMSVVLITLK
jgi:alpha-L-arabinofuranosidase